MTTDTTTPLSRLGRYEVLGRVGEGGMGVVYRGLAPGGQQVAIKVLRPHVAGDAEGRDRFAREVRAMRRVRGDHVAEVIDADVTATTPYVVTRYVDGPPLYQVVAEHGPLPEPELLRLGRGLADALRAVHAAGVVHRDLKPGNVLMLDGEPLVIDFGIAQVADETRLTSTGMLVGTPGYLAPEVVEGRRATGASDIHSWGATLAYAATGRPPFGRGPFESVMYRVVSGEADLDGVPPRVVPAIRSAMNRDPLRRPAAAELGRLLDGSGIAPIPAHIRTGIAEYPRTRMLPVDRAPVEPQPQRTKRAGPAAKPWPRPTRPHPLLALLLLLACAAAGAVAPLVTLVGLFVGGVVARLVDRQGLLLRRRRERRGRAASNGIAAVGALPWHAVRSALFTLLTLPIALVGAAALVLLASLVAPHEAHLGSTDVLAGLTLGGTGLFAWWGIEGESLRSGTNRVFNAIARPRPLAIALGVVLLAAVVVLAFTALTGPVHFWPLGDTSPSDWLRMGLQWLRAHSPF